MKKWRSWEGFYDAHILKNIALVVKKIKNIQAAVLAEQAGKNLITGHFARSQYIEQHAVKKKKAPAFLDC
jgi:hypothetical protein